MTFLTQQLPGLTRITQSTKQLWVRQRLRAVPAAQPASPGWWTLPALFFYLSVPLLHSFEKTMSEAAESSLKRRVAFGLGAVKYAEKSGKNGREKKREFHQGPAAQGSGKNCWTEQATQKTWAVKEMSFRALRGLSRFCSSRENSDMSKIKLEDKEWFVQNAFYFYPVWPRQFGLNIVFILVRSDFDINKITFLKNIFFPFFFSFFGSQTSPNMDYIGISS